jgi:hypothetical protein
MFGGVLVRRGIATKGFAAGLAGAQVYPATAYGYAFFALVSRCFFYFLVLRQVNTGFGV